MHKRDQKILDFWFKETPAKKRFQKHKDFDQLIKDKFLQDYELASKNEKVSARVGAVLYDPARAAFVCKVVPLCVRVHGLAQAVQDLGVLRLHWQRQPLVVTLQLPVCRFYHVVVTVVTTIHTTYILTHKNK